MFVFRNWTRTIVATVAILCARPGFGAPALTTVQDILYKADGTRFSGTLYITWNNFQSGDAATVPTQALTIPVLNGAFKVQLVPTTNASAGANYNVRYSSEGKFQFSETWAVPPSSITLRVRDVRISSGTIVGTPPPVITQLLISDVSGLSNELALRPAKGAGFQPARAAVISAAGQIEAVPGNLSDCVRVDGTSGPCGSSAISGSSAAFIDAETPAGIVDGVNLAFSLQSAPSPASSLTLYRNGLFMTQGLDYTLNGATVTFAASATPQPGDVVTASYRTATTPVLAASTVPQIICSSAGTSTSATYLVTLGSCTLPGGLLAAGDRVEIRFDYAHQGSDSGFNTQISWGSSIILVRAGVASDLTFSGRSSLGIDSTGSQWNTESWGTSEPLSITSGNSSDSLTNPITISLLGQLTGAVSDSLVLRNFTVVRYPVVTNP